MIKGGNRADHWEQVRKFSTACLFLLVSWFCMSCQRCKDSKEHLIKDRFFLSLTGQNNSFMTALSQKRMMHLISGCDLEYMFLGTMFCSFTYSFYTGTLQLTAFFWGGTTVTLWSFIIFYHYSGNENYILMIVNACAEWMLQ